jgi:hypothetical protein
MGEKKMCPKGTSWEYCIQDRCQWWVFTEIGTDCVQVIIAKALAEIRALRFGDN